ncbi:hypothetical protein Tco_0920533 [Tanacetum coccineum]
MPSDLYHVLHQRINMSGKVTSSQCVNNRSDRLRSRAPSVSRLSQLRIIVSRERYNLDNHDHNFKLLGATAVKKVKNATLGVHPDILPPKPPTKIWVQAIQQKPMNVCGLEILRAPYSSQVAHDMEAIAGAAPSI